MIDYDPEWQTEFLITEGDGINDIYKEMLSQVLERGIDVSPKGLPTIEVRPAVVIFLRPQERFLTCPGRYIHPFFQVLESIWILGGRGDVPFISYYLKNMEKYSDGEEDFNAPYGTRMRKHGCHRSENFPTSVRDQFADCYHALLRGGSTRQAVMTFWNPSFDHYSVNTSDRPCNIAFQFLIRKGKLHFTVFNRSNDVNWGLANANAVQFSVILETMSMLLGIPVGTQTHMINSLHVYDSQGDLTSNVLNADYKFNVYEYVRQNPFEMKFKTDNKIHDLDKELKMFFFLENKIRKGEFKDDSDITFNYLRDGLVLAKSFYFYKKNEFIQAANVLNGLKADDIFVSCLEFISRKCSKALIGKIVVERFRGKIASAFIEKLFYYLVHH